MSLATRCPVCQALFRVAPAQLRARTGQVRCGSCSAIFDGLAHLVPEAGKPAASIEASNPESESRNAETDAAAEALPDNVSANVPETAPVAPPPAPAAFDIFAPTPARPSAADGLRRQWKTIAASALLLVLLLAQLALRQRDMLAAEHPTLRGPLVALCSVVGCEVHLPRIVDRLAIEGDEMVATDPKAAESRRTHRHAA